MNTRGLSQNLAASARAPALLRILQASIGPNSYNVRVSELNPKRRRRRRARLSPLTVIGELLLLGGAAVLGYIVWQPWHTGTTVVAEQRQLSADESARWDAEAKPAGTLASGEIPVVAKPAAGEVFAVLHVPAFGTTFANRVAQSTDMATVLNAPDKGIGHYDVTQLPGEVGNFGVAAHRSGPFINAFREIMNLRVGDPLFIETADGWYTYRFRSLEYVFPDEVDVLDQFPRMAGVPGVDRILTLTTCNPKLSGTEERAIAYSVLEGFQPRSDGPPAELLKLNPELNEKVS